MALPPGACLHARRGEVKTTDILPNHRRINGIVPLANMIQYATSLRTTTSGRGTHTMEFSHYEKTPVRIQEEVVERQ